MDCLIIILNDMLQSNQKSEDRIQIVTQRLPLAKKFSIVKNHLDVSGRVIDISNKMNTTTANPTSKENENEVVVNPEQERIINKLEDILVKAREAREIYKNDSCSSKEKLEASNGDRKLKSNNHHFAQPNSSSSSAGSKDKSQFKFDVMAEFDVRLKSKANDKQQPVSISRAGRRVAAGPSYHKPTVSSLSRLVSEQRSDRPQRQQRGRRRPHSAHCGTTRHKLNSESPLNLYFDLDVLELGAAGKHINRQRATSNNMRCDQKSNPAASVVRSQNEELRKLTLPYLSSATHTISAQNADTSSSSRCRFIGRLNSMMSSGPSADLETLALYRKLNKYEAKLKNQKKQADLMRRSKSNVITIEYTDTSELLEYNRMFTDAQILLLHHKIATRLAPLLLEEISALKPITGANNDRVFSQMYRTAHVLLCTTNKTIPALVKE